MNSEDKTPAQRGCNAVEAPSLHVFWHWVILTVLMTALIGGAALLT